MNWFNYKVARCVYLLHGTGQWRCMTRDWWSIKTKSKVIKWLTKRSKQRNISLLNIKFILNQIYNFQHNFDGHEGNFYGGLHGLSQRFNFLMKRSDLGLWIIFRLFLCLFDSYYFSWKAITFSSQILILCLKNFLKFIKILLFLL